MRKKKFWKLYNKFPTFPNSHAIPVKYSIN